MKERYSLTQHEDGSWNVIDSLTGGPVELKGMLLYRMPLEEAELLQAALRHQDEELKEHLNDVLYGKP